MSVKELFNRSDKKRHISHVRNLIALAYADGKFTDDEKMYIANVAKECGINEKELKKIIEKPEDIKFFVPEKDEDKIEELYDLILLMMIDGELDENEIFFCRMIALRLGFSYQVVDIMVKTIIEYIYSDEFVDSVMDQLLTLLSNDKLIDEKN